MNRYVYVGLGAIVGLLLIDDAFGPPNLAVNAGILAFAGLLTVGLSMSWSVRVPNWSASTPRKTRAGTEGVEAMAGVVKDAAGGGYGSRIKIARTLSTVYAVNAAGISDPALISAKGRELVDRLLEKERWAELVLRPNPEGGPEPKGKAYLSVLEDALAIVSKENVV